MKIKMMTSACAGALSLVAFAAPAWAEDQTQQTAQEAASEVGEVVVTATRRATRLQDVPLSITAFSQQELTKKASWATRVWLAKLRASC